MGSAVTALLLTSTNVHPEGHAFTHATKTRAEDPPRSTPDLSEGSRLQNP